MEYRTSKHGDTATLRIVGELDALSVPEIRAELDRLVSDGDRQVLVDLSGLHLIDSSGVGALVSLFKRIRAEGRQFSVTGVHGQPMQIFEVLRLDHVFQIK